MFDEPQLLEPPLLGDVVICAPLVVREAEEQGKPINNHWAHLVIHGVLHLLGYDHDEKDQADTMENLERTLLNDFGIPDPYQASVNTVSKKAVC